MTAKNRNYDSFVSNNMKTGATQNHEERERQVWTIELVPAVSTAFHVTNRCEYLALTLLISASLLSGNVSERNQTYHLSTDDFF
jgi:hypothetical protein